MIELNNLTRCFGDVTAVDDITLSIPAGQICGYLGPNGAGKTTTVRMLTGMLPPTSGTAKVAGFDILSQRLDAQRRMGVVPESGALYQSLTPEEYLRFVGRLYGMDDPTIRTKTEEFLRFFGMESQLRQRMTTFSKGMKQKVVIAAALIHNPGVLFLDEPLSGLDANAALMLKALIRSLADEGKTVFYCSHVLEVVETLCDRVVILDKGRIVADGSVSELKQMTQRTSLESVFAGLTSAGDLGELARIFSKTVTGSGQAEQK